MFIGEGADQLREFATQLRKKNPPKPGPRTAYSQGYMAAVHDVLKALRIEVIKLDRARMKANSAQQD